MGKIIYWRDHFVIKVDTNKRGKYYTVSNLKGPGHAHLPTFEEAKLVARWGIRECVPEYLPGRIRHSIERILAEEDERGENFNGKKSRNNENING